MPIDADKVRELAARPEGTALDFKEADYDWSGKRPANTELAKDVAAMANSLRTGSEPAYILIGVKNDGTIVGVPPKSHLDDAPLHQKVGGLLNRTPSFSYAPVEVDGLSVGVYEIRAGGRPFFPLRDAHPLRRNVAVYRNGSSTDDASPSMILEWSREDDPEAHKLRSLELLKLEAEARVRGRLRSVSRIGNSDLIIGLEIENVGRSGFEVSSCRWEVQWNEKFAEHLAGYSLKLPENYTAASGEFAIDDAGIIPAGGKIAFKFKWTRAEALARLATAGIAVGFSPAYAGIRLAVPAVGDLGGQDTLHWLATA